MLGVKKNLHESREQHVHMGRRSRRDCACQGVAALVLPLRRPTYRRSHPTTSARPASPTAEDHPGPHADGVHPQTL